MGDLKWDKYSNKDVIDYLNISAISLFICSVITRVNYISVEQFLAKGTLTYFFIDAIIVTLGIIVIYKINAPRFIHAKRLPLILCLGFVFCVYIAFEKQEDLTIVFFLCAMSCVAMLMYMLLVKTQKLSTKFIVIMGLALVGLATLFMIYLDHHSYTISMVCVNGFLPSTVRYWYKNYRHLNHSMNK